MSFTILCIFAEAIKKADLIKITPKKHKDYGWQEIFQNMWEGQGQDVHSASRKTT